MVFTPKLLGVRTGSTCFVLDRKPKFRFMSCVHLLHVSDRSQQTETAYGRLIETGVFRLSIVIMVLLTMIARVADALPLAASMQEDEQAGRSLMDYQSQAKQLFRKISTDPQPPSKCSLESGPYIFHYIIERGVCFLILCDKTFSKRLAFQYLEDLQTEFSSQYSGRVETVSRPYSFIEFDTYIQKARKSYMDSRARKNLNNINTELQDVHRIMVQNIDDVLQRGETLSALDTKASNLSSVSQKYKKDATYLNLRASYAKIAAIIIVVIVFLLFIRFWW